MSGFDDFFAAIGGQESGGNYGAVNSSTGASGKYQIMPANIGPWGRKYLGMNISVGQFRSDPALQEKLARAVLESYYAQYGARGAAAAWYSGDAGRANDYGGTKGGPSVGSYVDQVLGRIGKTPTVPHQVAPEGAAALNPDAPSFGAPELNKVDPAMSGVDALSVTPNDMGQTMAMQQAKRALDPTAQATSVTGGKGSDATRDAILSQAMSFIGTPYVWGGTSPSGFDCSGLIQYVFGKNGISLPRISAAQANYGTRVDVADLRPGDLVAWDENSRNNGADHIAIYAGDGYIIEAPHTGASVRRRKLGKNEGAWGVSLGI